MNDNTLRIQTVPIHSLHGDPANARRHTRRNLAAITHSLQRFGQQKPIVVNADNQIIAGHGTHAAALALGWSEIQVIHSGLTGNEALAYAIADNRTAELAQWHVDILAVQLAALQIDAASPGDACGFDEKKIQEVIDQAAGLEPDPPGAQAVVFQVHVTCADDSDQRRVYQHFTDEGYSCRVLTL